MRWLVENRARLMLEVVDAAISVWGAERVGIHLSPGDQSYSVANSESKSTYDYVVQQLNLRGLAFVCVRESLDACIRSDPGLRKLFQGIFIANAALARRRRSRSSRAERQMPWHLGGPSSPTPISQAGLLWAPNSTFLIPRLFMQPCAMSDIPTIPRSGQSGDKENRAHRR